ncbi:MAG: sigma-70 family RNA polymerase sigma factor [Planctomycetia bacterium]|jgi:RNA polymerase primary sigma factor|nr:sigma-70 family RNA polymerase sigma factor [Planctomycetia bacterium]
MIALAKPFPARKKASRSATASKPVGKTVSRPAKKQLTPSEKRRRTILANKREALFNRDIEYIGGDVFFDADADKLASTPPVDARVPLQRSAAEAQAAAGRSLSPYLASLYQTRLLSKDEEQFYFRRMNWLKFQALQRRERLDPKRATMKQMKQIEGLLAEAETVKAILITSNLRLVVSIAKKFNEPSYSFDELISEGNVALMRSVEKFNFALGNRFSTYATYAIQRHFFRISHKSRQYRNRFATDDEPVRDRAEEPRDEEACTPGQVDFLRGLFGKFLNELEPREQQIVVARFGFDGDKPKTFRELGIEMGVCKERIRQIQTRAIEKLKTMAEEAQLEQTVGDWL